jgi:hypothetical protein
MTVPAGYCRSLQPCISGSPENIELLRPTAIRAVNAYWRSLHARSHRRSHRLLLGDIEEETGRQAHRDCINLVRQLALVPPKQRNFGGAPQVYRAFVIRIFCQGESPPNFLDTLEPDYHG